MKAKTVLAVTGGVIVGAVAGVTLCTTEFGQQKILVPAMALKNKFSKEDEEVEEQLEEGDENPGAEEHVEE